MYHPAHESQFLPGPIGVACGFGRLTPVDVRVVAPEDFARAAADAFLEAVAAAGPVVGLATGNTPRPMYEELRARVESGAVRTFVMRRMRPFAIDEYVCRRGDPCANRAYFAQHWETIPGAEAVVEFDGAADDVIGEARRVDGQLKEAGGLGVALLGIGTNGHLAFNEPGAPPFGGAGLVSLSEASRRAAAACWGDRPPSQGLTLGLAELLAARKVVLLAAGAQKAGVLAQALEGPVGAHCPASFLQEHVDLTVVADRAAAVALRSALGGP